MASYACCPFEEFRERMVHTIERMHKAFVEPEATWPGILFLEVPGRGLIVGEIGSVEGLDEAQKDHLASVLLPSRIRRSKADRFAWVMPAWRDGADERTECIVLVLGEVGHSEALIADVIRSEGPPRLGQWSEPSRTVEGLFVDPLSRALLAKRPWQGTGCRRRRRGAKPVQPRNRARSTRGRRALACRQPTCPDCSARIGEPHGPFCDVERCTVCHGQRLQCDCEGHDRLAAAWTGEWPGAAACRARGWWAVRTDQGWRPCAPGTPRAQEDYNRLSVYLQTGHDCLYEGIDYIIFFFYFLILFNFLNFFNYN